MRLGHRRWRNGAAGDRFHTGLGKGSSPRHGELHWVHRVGDWGFAGARHGEGRRRFAGDLRSRSKGPDSGPNQLLRLLHGKAKLHKVQLGATAQQGEAWPWRGGGAAPAAGDRPSRDPTDYRSVR